MDKLVPLLFDWGNIVFTVATMPQLYKTYVNRDILKDLSILSFALRTIATLFFFIAGIILRAPFATSLTAFNVFYNLLTIYWIQRCRK